MSVHLHPDLLARDLGIRDLSDPNGGTHAIQLLVQAAVDSLTSLRQCHVMLERGSRIVSIADNYDSLGFTSDSISRDSRYTRYVSETHMLRSHASAIIPGALRRLSSTAERDLLIACPGIVYRRDSIDRLHTGTPHQIDLWRITDTALGDADMDEMIATLVETLAPGHEYRCEPRTHPYTCNGRQIDVLWNDEWVEIAECGIVNREILQKAGLPEAYGLAIGLGLDRLMMLRKSIPDVRLLRSTDPRIELQMHDLNEYRPVSSMPAIRRDLSVAVDQRDLNEDLGDRVRDALGADADVVEEVAVVSDTAYESLSDAARARIGMAVTQKNVLVRVTLRALDRTLSNEEANLLRDRIYRAIHQGSRSQLSQADRH